MKENVKNITNLWRSCKILREVSTSDKVETRLSKRITFFSEITDIVVRNIDMNIDISFRRFAFTSGIDVERISEGMQNIVS